MLRAIKTLLSDRWQIPLAAVALGLAGLAYSRLKPPPREIVFDALVADLTALVEKQAYYDAADSAVNLLALQPPLEAEQRAYLENFLSEVIYTQELLREEPNPVNAQLILDHQAASVALGRSLDAAASFRLARAHGWLGQTEEAIAEYRETLNREPPVELRREALQALAELLDGRPDAAGEREAVVRALLAEEGVSPAYAWGALRTAIGDALESGDFARAREVLERDAERFKRSDLRGYHEHLWAWVLTAEDQIDEALPLIQWVDEWLDVTVVDDPALHRAGFLPVLNRWLRAECDLRDGRPQAALLRFEEAVALQNYGPLLVPLTIGRATALARLERHDAAREIFRETIGVLSMQPTQLAGARGRLRRGLISLYEERDGLSDFPNAVRYLEMAVSLAPPAEREVRQILLALLGRENERAAEVEATEDAARAYRENAGAAYSASAALVVDDEDLRAGLHWQAAQQFDMAGYARLARENLVRFLDGPAKDKRRPQALLRLGQAHAADGEYETAIGWFRQLAEEFPSLPETSRGRLLHADALLAQGESRYEEGLALLEELLATGGVGPESPVYRDALFALTDLLYQRGEYGKAIRRVQDALELYPDDPERHRLRFLLADAHRQSALALRTEPEPDRTRALEAERRLDRAADEFGAFLADTRERQADVAGLDVLRRLALLYRADCLYERNTPDALEEALSLYRQAAALYQSEPAALSAQVQISNIQLRQGRSVEAARALEHARWLMRGMPDAAFEGALSRAAWDEFLTAASKSHLFRDVFAAAP